ncbi:hypothetical protein Tco_1158129 [Tanacetum coccineum]
MSFGSQTIGDAIVQKFDMHVYTSVLTSDKVKSLVAEYAIPSDLHPCVPPSGLTMNRLPINKIDSSVADPPPTGVQAEDICRLCENVIDLRLVYPAMLYAIGLTTIWDHVGQHPIFKDGERTVATSMSLFREVARWLVKQRGGRCEAAWALFSLIPEKSDHQKVVEYENERVLAAKRKAQAAKDRAVEKRAATKGASHRPKKKKTTPFTIIPNKAELTTEGDGLILESVNLVEEDTNHNLHNVEDTTKVNSPFSEHSPRSQHSNPSDEYTHDVRNEPTHTHAFGSTAASHCLQRLLSSDKYKKSMSDVFNLAIATGWSKGVKAACSKEVAEAFLATAIDYDPACKTTFMSLFDSFFNKSYPYVEKLVESFRLPLGDLQNMWPKGTRPTLSGNVVDVQ